MTYVFIINETKSLRVESEIDTSTARAVVAKRAQHASVTMTLPIFVYFQFKVFSCNATVS